MTCSIAKKACFSCGFSSKLIFMEHGPPDRLQTDNGGEFKKELIKVNKYNLDITLIFGKCGFSHKIFFI